jgi:hypothetical protein
MKVFAKGFFLAVCLALVLTVSAFAADDVKPPSGGQTPPSAELAISEDGLSVTFTGSHVKFTDLYVEYCDGTWELIPFERPIRPPYTWESEKPVTYADSLVWFYGDEDLTLVKADPRPCPGGVERPRCPTCGRPVWESTRGEDGRGPEGLAMVWFGVTPCQVCQVGGDFFLEFDRRFRAWSTIDFSFEGPAGVLHEAEEVIGQDGVTYYVLEGDAHLADTAIIWGPGGIGDRFRDHGPVYKYSACGVAPGYYDAPNGTAIWKPGHSVSDWAQFLLNNGFFEDEQYRGDAALAWANQLRTEGQLALP